MFKKFELDQGIQYAFHKFVVLCKRKFSVIVDGKAIKSTTQGIYLGYKLDFSKEAIISDAHANFQYDKLSRLLPQYITLCKLLNTKQALKVLTTFILPSFYYNFSPNNFSKGVTNKINILLRKFSAVAWKCCSKDVGSVTPDIKDVMKHRFNYLKYRAFNQNMIDLYDHKRDLLPQDIQLVKWNGRNRYFVTSLLSVSLTKKRNENSSFHSTMKTLMNCIQ